MRHLLIYIIVTIWWSYAASQTYVGIKTVKTLTINPYTLRNVNIIVYSHPKSAYHIVTYLLLSSFTFSLLVNFVTPCLLLYCSFHCRSVSHSPLFIVLFVIFGLLANQQMYFRRDQVLQSISAAVFRCGGSSKQGSGNATGLIPLSFVPKPSNPERW